MGFQMNSGMIRNKKPVPTKVRTGFDPFRDSFFGALPRIEGIWKSGGENDIF
jgi:hypothetical protein